MKYDDVVKFLRQKANPAKRELEDKYRVVVNDGDIVFVNGMPDYTSQESDAHRYVLAWTWLDEGAAVSANIPSSVYLFMTHNPSEFGDKKVVSRFNPSAGKFIKKTESEFDYSIVGVSYKDVLVHRKAMIERLTSETVRIGSIKQAAKMPKRTAASFVTPFIVDLFPDQPMCSEQRRSIERELKSRFQS